MGPRTTDQGRPISSTKVHSHLKGQGEEQHFHSPWSYFSLKTMFLLCSMVDSPQCFLFLHQSDQPTDHLFLGSQVGLILTYISNYVHDDRARSYISRRRISPMALPSPSPGHGPVVMLLICTSIVAQLLTLMAVSLPWRLWVETRLALRSLWARKGGSRHYPIENLRGPSRCMKNVAHLVPGYVVIKIVSVESSVCQVTKDPPPGF